MASTIAAAVAVSTFVSGLLCIPPLILQLQARSLVISILIASTLIVDILYFVNALIWPTRYPSGWEGQGLCDIEIKLRIGLDMTVSGGIVCLFRQLCSITDPLQYSRLSRVQNRNTSIFEATLCGMLPILRMILSYVVQPDRYWIFGIYGCTPSVDTSWPSYALVLVWPLVVDLGALWYGALATKQILKHSREVSKLLPGGQIPASKRRTARLLYMGVLLIILEALTRAVVFWWEIMPFLVPYSWSRIHPPDWSRKIEKASFRPINLAVYGRNIAHSIIIFGFLGCSAEAIAVYRVWLGQSRSHLWWASMIKQPQASNKKVRVPRTSSNHRPTRDFGHELATT